MHLKIKDPDYKTLYFSCLDSKRQLVEKHDKQISGYKARVTTLENELKKKDVCTHGKIESIIIVTK